MELNLTGRKALITGGSAGIGYAIARELALEGSDVVIAARDVARLNKAAEDIAGETGRIAIPIHGDMSKEDDTGWVAQAAVDALGQVDILVNNAGSAPAGRIAAMSDEEWIGAINLKLMGYVRKARALTPDMRERGWGRVINIVGRLGHQPSANNIIGSPVNAAAQNFTVALAAECAPDQVLVNAINPGPIRTARHYRLVKQRAEANNVTIEEIEQRTVARVPVGRYGKPDEIAAVAAFLCSDRAGFITGTMINVDGGGTGRV